MKEIPILFSTPMVQAILDDRKTMTRRVVKNAYTPYTKEIRRIHPMEHVFVPYDEFDRSAGKGVICPYGKPGDRLFVRESWKLVGWDFEDGEARIQYADGTEYSFPTPDDDDCKGYNWLVRQFEKLLAKDIIMPESDDDECQMIFTGEKHPFSPSIHLPKWCSRIWLEVTDVRVERLQDISQEDAKAEGMFTAPHRCTGWKNELLGFSDCYVCPFKVLWNQINGERGMGWEVNPWVWVVSFKVISKTGRPEILNELINQ